MILRSGRIAYLYLGLCISSSLIFAAEPTKAECVFKDVGQGHCVVLKTMLTDDVGANVKIDTLLIADAGSSEGNTIQDKRLSAAELALTIVSPEEIRSANKVVFFVSHPDKDHINIFTEMMKSAKQKTKMRKAQEEQARHIQEALASHGNVSIYLGGCLHDYFYNRSSVSGYHKPGLDFLQSCLIGSVNAQSLSHWCRLTPDYRQAIENIHTMPEQYPQLPAQSGVPEPTIAQQEQWIKIHNIIDSEPRPFLMHHYLPELSGVVRAQVLAANRYREIQDIQNPERCVLFAVESGIRFLPPGSSQINYKAEDTNTNSAILRIECNVTANPWSVVLLGDSTQDTVQALKEALDKRNILENISATSRSAEEFLEKMLQIHCMYCTKIYVQALKELVKSLNKGNTKDTIQAECRTCQSQYMQYMQKMKQHYDTSVLRAQRTLYKQQYVEGKILLGSHHGSRDDGCNDIHMLTFFNPERIIYSGHSPNSYRHPHPLSIANALCYLQSKQCAKVSKHRVIFAQKSQEDEIDSFDCASIDDYRALFRMGDADSVYYHMFEEEFNFLIGFETELPLYTTINGDIAVTARADTLRYPPLSYQAYPSIHISQKLLV